MFEARAAIRVGHGCFCFRWPLPLAYLPCLILTASAPAVTPMRDESM
eukprot:COSAG06_NODE_39821_length_408_cov_0.996764_1_plen_46_part_10